MGWRVADYVGSIPRFGNCLFGRNHHYLYFDCGLVPKLQSTYSNDGGNTIIVDRNCAGPLDYGRFFHGNLLYWDDCFGRNYGAKLGTVDRFYKSTYRRGNSVKTSCN